MSELATKQRELVRQFDDEASYFMDGQVKVMFAAGANGSLQNLRQVGEKIRPLCVTLEPQTTGRLMLGITVSRPKNGQLVYETLGQWDLTVPIRRGGALNPEKPRHQRAAAWGLQLLRGLIADARAARSGSDPVRALDMPRVFVPFKPGQEQVDATLAAETPDAVIDTQSLAGQTLVDSRVVPPAALATAIGTCSALEDYRPLLGQDIPNPFRHAAATGLLFNGQYVPLSQIHADAEQALLRRARAALGKDSKGATTADIIAACAKPQSPMRLSLFARHQLVSLEALGELPAPYAGCALPPVNWQRRKTRLLVG